MCKSERVEATMPEADLVSLYSQRILALAADIPHLGRLDLPQGSARRRAPLCGSVVTVDLVVENGRVARFAQDVKACALGQASASVVGRSILGRTRDEIETARDQLARLLAEGGPRPDAPFDGLEVLRPAKDFANRHASILLCLDATLDAFDEAIRTAA
jgi:NifU-like protein involved in Fe-S cluster formation